MVIHFRLFQSKCIAIEMNCSRICEQLFFGSDVVPVEAMEVNETLILGFSSK